MSDHRTYVASLRFGSDEESIQVLITVWDEDKIEVAARAKAWHTWGPPAQAERM